MQEFVESYVKEEILTEEEMGSFKVCLCFCTIELMINLKNTSVF